MITRETHHRWANHLALRLRGTRYSMYIQNRTTTPPDLCGLLFSLRGLFFNYLDFYHCGGGVLCGTGGGIYYCSNLSR